MTPRTNEFSQPIGEELPHYRPRKRPKRVTLEGTHCRVEPLVAGHIGQLVSAFGSELQGPLWTYLPVGPFASEEELRELLTGLTESQDPLHFAIVDKHSGLAVGTFALMRHSPHNGAVEMGWVIYSPALRRTIAATEAQYLVMEYVFDQLGYRRYEWKCDSLNAPSRRAAERLGFSYEGTFRQAVVYKGRNRDTAWFSIIDGEWPALKRAFSAWLDPNNFEGGRQLKSLPEANRKVRQS